MFRDGTARGDREISGSRRRSLSRLLVSLRDGASIGAFVGLLLCLGAGDISASPPALPHKAVDHRTIRTTPHRLVIDPSSAIVAVNQLQRFTVTDAQGRTVAVHWSVSGLGCSGAACGTIDGLGVYRTPPSLPRPRVVTLEAVPVADPNYSVLTEIRLQDAATATVSPAFDQPSARKPEQLPAPVIGGQAIFSRVKMLPQPLAVAPAPAIGGRGQIRAVELPPLPRIVAAAPSVAKAQIVHNTETLALPLAVLPIPVAEVATAFPAIGALVLPRAIGPAPALEASYGARTAGVPPLPQSVMPPDTPSHVLMDGAEQLSRPDTGTPNTASTALPPMPEDHSVAPVSPAVVAQQGPAVTYQEGQLSIDTRNSTLAEVLKLVAEKTGATIDVPAGSGLDRIVEHAGPGPAKDVLWQLLNGSSFNFIIISSPRPPYTPTQVLLSLQAAGTDIANPVSAAPKIVASNPTWTPSQSPSIEILPPQYDSSLTAPKEAVSPEARGELMKEKAREIRERVQQLYPQQ